MAVLPAQRADRARLSVDVYATRADRSGRGFAGADQRSVEFRGVGAGVAAWSIESDRVAMRSTANEELLVTDARWCLPVVERLLSTEKRRGGEDAPTGLYRTSRPGSLRLSLCRCCLARRSCFFTRFHKRIVFTGFLNSWRSRPEGDGARVPVFIKGRTVRVLVVPTAAPRPLARIAALIRSSRAYPSRSSPLDDAAEMFSSRRAAGRARTHVNFFAASYTSLDGPHALASRGALCRLVRAHDATREPPHRPGATGGDRALPCGPAERVHLGGGGGGGVGEGPVASFPIGVWRRRRL